MRRRVLSLFLCLVEALYGLSQSRQIAQTTDIRTNDTALVSSGTQLLPLDLNRVEHGAELMAVPAYIFPTHAFLKGHNATGKPIRSAFSAHVRYAFRYPGNTAVGKFYGCPAQGVGAGLLRFGERRQVGSPFVFYLYQEAQLARLSTRLTARYEWNLGMSFGWHPYDSDANPYNRTIGSRVNASLGASLYLDYALTKHIALRSGILLNHYSNGNTAMPNAGLNTIGLRMGVVYRQSSGMEKEAGPFAAGVVCPSFRPYVNYDVTVFGAWRRKNFYRGGEGFASPCKYGVSGIQFAPMYNVSRRVRLGLSLDGVYDVSANLRTDSDTPERGSVSDRFALGLSGRAEFVMPFFIIGAGYGRHVLYGSSDVRGWYQVLTLKAAVTYNAYLHVGYNLKDLKEPNYLMLGVGYRFNNRSPLRL